MDSTPPINPSFMTRKRTLFVGPLGLEQPQSRNLTLKFRWNYQDPPWICHLESSKVLCYWAEGPLTKRPLRLQMESDPSYRAHFQHFHSKDLVINLVWCGGFYTMECLVWTTSFRMIPQRIQISFQWWNKFLYDSPHQETPDPSIMTLNNNNQTTNIMPIICIEEYKLL